MQKYIKKHSHFSCNSVPFCVSTTVTMCSNGRRGPGGNSGRAGRAPLIQALHLLPRVGQGFQNWWLHLDHPIQKLLLDLLLTNLTYPS